MSGSGDGQDHVGTPRPGALIPAREEGQLTALRRSGASGTGCPLTGKCGGKRCRSTRPWAGIPGPARSAWACSPGSCLSRDETAAAAGPDQQRF